MRDLGDPVLAIPLQVTKRKGESEEQMIRRFMKKVRNEGVVREYLDMTSYYEKPSVAKRKKRIRARNRRD